MGYVKGDNIRFWQAGIRLDLEMEVTIDASGDTIETTDKDSAGWKTFIIGDKSWTVSGSGNVDFSKTTNVENQFTAFNAGAEVEIDVGSANDTVFYSGQGLITKWKIGRA